MSEEAQRETQRGPEMDIIDLIANLQAVVSHAYELYNKTDVDLKSDEFDVVDEAELVSTNQFLHEVIYEANHLRKEVTAELKKLSPHYDKEYHCLLKHMIISYELALELFLNDMASAERYDIAMSTTQLMYKIVSKYMWVGLATCGRCLSDELENER